MDEIWFEDRFSGKINAHFLRILLKNISTEVINILCKNKLTTPT